MAADLVNPKRRMAKGEDLERSTKLPVSLSVFVCQLMEAG
jgi:hypothetical protein